jgi:hypothetical protein
MPIPYLYPTSFPYGSRVVTFTFSGGGTGAAILESFESTEPTTEINRQNELGAPNGFALIAEPRTATATAQLATTSSTYIQRGDTCSVAITSGGAITFVVSQSSNPEASRESKKQSLTLREVI